MPVKFKDVEYIRIDSYKKKLKECPDIERELWRIFSKVTFEKMIALEGVLEDQILKLLDYPPYFELLSLDLPENRNGIIDALKKDGMVSKCETGGYNITNLGAILFAKRLSDFQFLSRKPIRVITYNGKNKIASSHEQVGGKGDAAGFEGCL